ncbi:PEP-utilizing enzyme [Helicobacter zhangjianzhongii]|uniref:PEP-utilizing enzyme n=1 Tax=Helicobacter zhangjianzhongii TaxID=2974574 RepID=UPI002553D777|nr:PEP-utilizing enzyme [Helicobacter sp. CPD2-1]MDL0080515.1 PEP-utilizing enzyme [Helicobacter sp. CPD2-1]
MELGTKARTLELLQGQLHSAQVLPLVITSLLELAQAQEALLARIAELKSEKLIVRSSSRSEDTASTSNAGAFLSLANIPASDTKALLEAIEQVGASMPESSDEILIQPMLDSIALCGVGFSVDKESNAPYFCISYDTSGDNASVTSGSTNAISYFVQYRSTPCSEPLMARVVALISELESIFSCRALDVEFAFVKAEGQCSEVDSRNEAQNLKMPAKDSSLAQEEIGELYCLQVRPLVMQGKQDLYDIITPRALERLSKRIKALSAPHPNVLGQKAIFGVMPDWNPAEIIGLKPKRLALSLYKEIVTDGVWAYQRDNYGYRNLRSHPLMHSFLGIPYIDVRVSFNSFIPKHLDENIATKLVDYYLKALESTPESHDKVEFDIVFSCYDFSTPKRLRKLLEHGFNDNELKRIEFALLNLTNSVLAKDSGLYRKDLEKSQKLESRYSAIVDSSLSLYDKIYWLLEECKRFGTLPFAGVARAAFIAMQILRSLVEIGFLSTQEKEEFLSSLHTISKQLSDDIAHLQEDSIDEFLAVYGHLRAGSYDILSARYDEGFDYYFGSKCGDSACSDKSPILRRGLAHYRLDKSLRPRLESGDFSSTILESQSSTEITNPTTSKFKLESTFTQSTDSSSKILPRETKGEQKVDSSTAATPRILEEDNQAECENPPPPLESTFEQNSHSTHNAHLSSLRDTAPAVAWQSTQTQTQNLESIFENPTTDAQKADSSNDYSASAELVDCHADKSARNDTKNATSKKVDSRDKNAQSAFDKQAAGGRICDEKAGLCSGEQGDKTCGLSTPRAANSLLFRAKQAKRCERELAGFFRKPTPKPSQAESPQQKPYHISSDRLRALDSLLKEHGLEICAKDLFVFLKQAIEGRESVKFAFSKFLSKALSYIKELGESLQIPASDMAHLDIKSILSLYASLYKDSPKERFLQEIAANKQEYNLTCALKLPALITKPDEVFAFFSSKVVPNFITQKLVIGEAIELDSTTQQNLQGSIVLIKSADPGYDYLFTKDIAGFITCYGGSNSHMAIRASELQIPAVIGVGEHAYQAYASATRIQLDCQAQRIVCL